MSCFWKRVKTFLLSRMIITSVISILLASKSKHSFNAFFSNVFISQGPVSSFGNSVVSQREDRRLQQFNKSIPLTESSACLPYTTVLREYSMYWLSSAPRKRATINQTLRLLPFDTTDVDQQRGSSLGHWTGARLQCVVGCSYQQSSFWEGSSK